jgi:predicted metal-dependent hydrolase
MLTSGFFKTSVEINGSLIPVKVHIEKRAGVRYSLGRKGAILRMPYIYDSTRQESEFLKFRNWVEQRVSKKNEFNTHFEQRNLKNGDELEVGIKKYTVLFEEHHGKVHSGRLKNGIITLKISEGLIVADRLLVQKKLLSRLVAKDQFTYIAGRVKDLNDKYFKKPINNVFLKYNLSNWGSCSAKGNINLSTCLLFAKTDVIDYVIIHELAHLTEMNHSPKFWRLVENAMPDYKVKIQWLKENWGKCDF